MKKWVGIVAAAVCISLMAGCTTSKPPPQQALPATPLDGWVRVATPLSAASGLIQVNVSPNGRYIVYETTEVRPGDTDAHPNQSNLYLLDRSTGDYHLIRDWLADTWDVTDDGRVLVTYQENTFTESHYAIYTIPGGLGTPFDRPPGSCDIRLEEGGTGLELLCRGNGTEPAGIYRFDPGDTDATPVQVTVGLSDDMKVRGNSPNRRYLLIGSNQTDATWVYDDQTDTLLPFTIDQPLTLPINVTQHHLGGAVFDDGRRLITSLVWGTNLDAVHTGWYDPRTGTIEYMSNYGAASIGDAIAGTDYLVLTDYTREIGRHYEFDERATNDKDTDTILGTFSSPTTRWLLPYQSGVLAVTADDDIIVQSTQPLDPNDTSPGIGIYVREGPLPPPPA